MKVLELLSITSLVPIRVRRRSVTRMLAKLAGTKLPIWAMMTSKATCRRYVDLPDMLGPVRTWKLEQSARYVSFACMSKVASANNF